MSRDIRKGTSRLQAMYHRFEAEMTKAGLPFWRPGMEAGFIITSVDRYITEQMALYAQGRLAVDDVNRYRSAAGLAYRIGARENRTVTWTLESKHIINPAKQESAGGSRAFDIAIIKDGKAIWDTKVSVNDNSIPDYEEAGRIWVRVGGIWGGDWKRPDYPHMEI